MASVSCHAVPSHAAVWRCSCAQPNLSFCTACLPQHLQSGGPHSISSIPAAGSPPLDVTGVPSYPRPPAEAAAKQAAERQEMNAKARGEQPQGPIAVFIQSKNGINHNFSQVMENVNILQDAYLRVVERLDEMKEELTRKQEEINRLQALQRPQAAPANEALIASLKTQLDQLSSNLQSQDALKEEIRNLKNKVSLLEAQLQHSVEGAKFNAKDIQEVARTVVDKVSVALPLVSHMDRGWLDREGAESFLELSKLVISDEIQFPCVRQVARVCSLLARASGPGSHVAVFTNQVSKRLIGGNSERTLQLINQLEELYLKLKDLPASKASFQRLLRLADSEAFEGTVSILLHFANSLEGDQLTLYGDVVMEFFAHDALCREDWRSVLLGLQDLPIYWTGEFAEEMSQVLKAVVKQDFDPLSLKLIALLAFKPDNPALLLSFATRTASLLAIPECLESVDVLLREVTDKLTEADHLPSAQCTKACDRIFQALRLVKPTSTPTELQQTARLLAQLNPGQTLFQTACSIVESFQGFKDEASMTRLGLKAMDWLLPGDEPRDKAAEWLLPLVRGAASSAEQVETLAKMIQKLPLEKSLEMTLRLARSAKALGPQLSTVTNSCLSLLERVPNPVAVADKVCELLKRNRTEGLIRACTCFAGLTKYKDTLTFTCEVLASLSEQQDGALLLLQELTRVLANDKLPQDLILRMPALWLHARRRLPQDTRMAAFCVFALKKLREADLPHLLSETQGVFEEEGASYKTALQLTEVYIKYPLPENLLSKWLVQLRSLRGADNLETLFNQVNRLPQASLKLMTGFVETVLLQCAAEPAKVAETSRSLQGLLGKGEDALKLITNLSELSDRELVGSLLTTARLQQDTSVLKSCSELSTLLVFFERDHFPPPELSFLRLRRAEDVTKLVGACHLLVQNPAHQMTALSCRLLTELNSRPNAELLHLIPQMVMSLIDTVPPGALHDLAMELIEASRDGAEGGKDYASVRGKLEELVRAGERVLKELGGLATVEGKPATGEARVRKVQGSFPQIKDQVKAMLMEGKKVSLEDLEQLLLKHTELVHVTATHLRLFNFQNYTWGPQVPLSRQIVADNGSRWVILEDKRVFCCGGEYYAGYTSSSSSINYLAAGGRNEAYILTRQGAVDQKANMNVGRGYHGVLAINNAVYVFGGCMF